MIKRTDRGDWRVDFTITYQDYAVLSFDFATDLTWYDVYFTVRRADNDPMVVLTKQATTLDITTWLMEITIDKDNTPTDERVNFAPSWQYVYDIQSKEIATDWKRNTKFYWSVTIVNDVTKT